MYGIMRIILGVLRTITSRTGSLLHGKESSTLYKGNPKVHSHSRAYISPLSVSVHLRQTRGSTSGKIPMKRPRTEYYKQSFEHKTIVYESK